MKSDTHYRMGVRCIISPDLVHCSAELIGVVRLKTGSGGLHRRKEKRSHRGKSDSLCGQNLCDLPEVTRVSK